LFLKGGILRSGNNIQDRLCNLRKDVHFCAKRLHGFNEGKKAGKEIPTFLQQPKMRG